MSPEALILLGVFGGGVLGGLLSRWVPISGWAALAFPLLLPLLGVGLAVVFC